MILGVAVALDLLLGEPPARLHPVVWLGALIDCAERRTPAPERRASLAYGAVAVFGLVGAAASAAFGLDRVTACLPRFLRIVAVAVLLKPAFALRALLEAGSSVRAALDRGDVPQARAALRALVSRETATLAPDEVAGAAIESLAENTTDSFVGPWLAWWLFGLPGAWAFRTVNTLDSRWGYHGRYERLGRVAARLDDVCAAIPARLAALLLVGAAALSGASPGRALRVLLRDHGHTSSPNAGWTMAAMAGALGRKLSKRGAYTLNSEGGVCCAADIATAQRIISVSAALALAAATISQAAFRPRAWSRDPIPQPAGGVTKRLTR